MPFECRFITDQCYAAHVTLICSHTRLHISLNIPSTPSLCCLGSGPLSILTLSSTSEPTYWPFCILPSPPLPYFGVVVHTVCSREADKERLTCLLGHFHHHFCSLGWTQPREKHQPSSRSRGWRSRLTCHFLLSQDRQYRQPQVWEGVKRQEWSVGARGETGKN